MGEIIILILFKRMDTNYMVKRGRSQLSNQPISMNKTFYAQQAYSRQDSLSNPYATLSCKYAFLLKLSLALKEGTKNSRNNGSN